MKKENDVKLDEAATLKAMLSTMFEQQTLYFELATKVGNSAKKTEALSKNTLKMTMADQIKVLTLMSKVADLADDLCDKYGFETE